MRISFFKIKGWDDVKKLDEIKNRLNKLRNEYDLNILNEINQIVEYWSDTLKINEKKSKKNLDVNIF
jgi:hypothetical protein